MHKNLIQEKILSTKSPIIKQRAEQTPTNTPGGIATLIGHPSS